jgi:hypothetical protein
MYVDNCMIAVVRAVGVKAEPVRPYSSGFARLTVISAKCCSLGEPSIRYRPSQRIAARSYLREPRSA